MRHFRDPKFKPLYDALPPRVRDLADKNFAAEAGSQAPIASFQANTDDLWSGTNGLNISEKVTKVNERYAGRHLKDLLGRRTSSRGKKHAAE